jgi:hypothetical protein
VWSKATPAFLVKVVPTNGERPIFFMFKTITHIVASMVQGYAMKLFCWLLVLLPFVAYLYGYCQIVKHGLLALLYLAIVWFVSTCLMSSSVIEKLNHQFNEQE